MISISILNIKDNIDKIEEIDSLESDYIHIDIMDGKFVPNKVDMEELPNLNTKRDVHLMVYDVYKYIDIYKKYNPEYITFHVEAVDNVKEVIEYIHSLGIKVGLSIKPNTSVNSILEYLNDIDLVLVMSVEPGAGGQKFIMNSTNKIEELYDIRNSNNYKYMIEVDGGVNYNTKDLCNKADILVVGSYITKSDDVKDKYLSMQ